MHARRSRKGPTPWAHAALFAVIALALFGGQAAAATTWYVDGTLGNDANSCTAPGLSACRTIQAAINKASDGDTIIVAAGLYPEPAPGPLSVNKDLTLAGAQAGVDARTRVAPESIISDPQGTSVSKSGVIIDGFTVANSTVSSFTGFGIWLNPGIGGTQIVNNIIENNIVGIGLANKGAQAVIRHNFIRNNDQPGSSTGSGIYTDQFVGGPRVENVLIDENTFAGHGDGGAAINISNTDFTQGVFALEVAANLFTANNRAFLLFNTHRSTFHDNVMTASTFVGSADIRLFDNNTDLLFTNNSLSAGAGHAIRFSFFFGRPSSNVDFHQNNIGTIGSASYALTGLTVDAGSHAGTVDAECNWWGSNTGPTSPNNPGGTGEEVVGDADFAPWLISPAPGGPCIGGLPPTPGKVTGGGQTDGEDPLFSPLGELLTLPAIIPSLSDPTAQSTFGLVARCCPTSGNLEYKDHQAGVRIKARSVDGLSITSPGTSCPAVPGSKHATFFGMAEVTRSTGTTTEEYTVEVDDCGEPGTNDTFGISTFTYANPPSTLIGGNIQIR